MVDVAARQADGLTLQHSADRVKISQLIAAKRSYQRPAVVQELNNT